MGAAAGGDDVRMLDEEQRVGDLVALARLTSSRCRAQTSPNSRVPRSMRRAGLRAQAWRHRFTNLDRFAEARLGGLHERLGERRVGVDGEAEVVRQRAHLDRQRRLGDDVGGAVADDVDAQHLLAVGVDHHLHEPVGVGVGDGAAERREGELADLDLAPPFLVASSALMPGRGDLGSLKIDGGDARARPSPPCARRSPRRPPRPRATPCAPASAGRRRRRWRRCRGRWCAAACRRGRSRVRS